MKAEDKLKVRSFVLSVSDPNQISVKTITRHVDCISLDIESYKNTEDIIILTRLMNWCISKCLPVQQAKMKRNLGMYYFYNRQKDKAYQYLNEAIQLFRRRKAGEMLVASLSDLGLIHFFDYQYQMSRLFLEEALALLNKLKTVRYPIKFLLFYRMGFLLSYLKEYDSAQKMLAIALTHARGARDKGGTVLNMGVNYKRQQLYTEAMACYEKAYSIYGPTQLILKCGALNNMADLYREQGDYDTAIRYIIKAFQYLECKDMAYFFMCFQTYTEIKILQGESSDIIFQLLELLRKVKDFYMYKCFIVDGLYVFKRVCHSDKKLLTGFERELKELVQSAGEKNEAFKAELSTCLDEVRLSLSILSAN